MIKVIFLSLITWTNPGTPADSLRMETVNGKQFIIHRIEDKETLYAISRKYGVPITNILEFNKGADGSLAVGQLLKIPYTPKVKTPVATQRERTHTVSAGETLFSISKLYDVSVDELKEWNNLKDNSLSAGQQLVLRKKTATTTENVRVPNVQSVSSTHTVAAKETLFSIARQYNITVQQLKTWNDLTVDEVKIGQSLIVVQPKYSEQVKSITTEQKPIENKPEIKESTTVVVPERKPEPEVKETTIKISEKLSGSDEVKEGGLAELIDGSEGNRKYLALHRTAKTGTILKVRNELNNREVFVRVAGPLPNTGVNTNLVIKISKSAYDRLGAIDPRFRVEVTYYK